MTLGGGSSIGTTGAAPSLARAVTCAGLATQCSSITGSRGRKAARTRPTTSPCIAARTIGSWPSGRGSGGVRAVGSEQVRGHRSLAWEVVRAPSINPRPACRRTQGRSSVEWSRPEAGIAERPPRTANSMLERTEYAATLPPRGRAPPCPPTRLREIRDHSRIPVYLNGRQWELQICSTDRYQRARVRAQRC